MDIEPFEEELMELEAYTQDRELLRLAQVARDAWQAARGSDAKPILWEKLEDAARLRWINVARVLRRDFEVAHRAAVILVDEL